ncbi:hypothetical protein SAMN05444273_10313 [Litoreibacter ascidiaceicola]|uniref:Uncharacterized protein n=1 Tax=Litoreibacter ascidiaceicola TaxID=1486859 RepID=A0A1M4X255_9RHOB|nr:hypothetical protein [Litoreibacter ascidiaceicola]SHE87581.1 hypothetical protein SAMN05444273_10313 [Litoreibacter ascidiaceicola]
MADGNPKTPCPGTVAAQAQAGAPASQGEMDRICLPCSGQIMVEACYVDAWNTPLTDACVKVEDSTGVVVDGAIRTEPLAAHGQKDGDAPTAPLVTMGTTPLIEVAHGITDVSLVAQGAGEADSGMDDLGAALTAFRDDALTKLQPYVAEWEAKGLLSIPEARLRGIGKGLSSWYQGEASFWGGVSEKAISAYQSAQNWHDNYVASQSEFEQFLLKWGGPGGAAIVYGTSMAETVAESVTEWIGGIGDLSDYIDTIMAAMRNLASGTVDLMEAALDTLRDLPGDLGKLFAQLIDNGQDWIEAMVLIASETNAFEYVFHIIMSVAMNMVPNFWSEMVGVVTGFILPEVLIEIILAVIAALTVGGGSVLVAGRLATFVVKLRGLAVKAKSLGVLADIVEAFGKAITALAKIGKGLHDEIEAATRAGADGVARIRRRLNQYKIEVDPNTLGSNGGNIRITRKKGRFARTQDEFDDLARDPAHGGKTTPATKAERDVGLGLEDNGEVPGPIRRDPTGGAEFIDASGVEWDVKAYRSEFPNGFNAERVESQLNMSRRLGENVMIDTRGLSSTDLSSVREIVTRNGLDENVKFWP